MNNRLIEIKPYEEKYRQQIVDVWENSVRATHHFLLPEDIVFYKGFVNQIDFSSFTVYCLVSENTLLGFLGVAEKKIEMLFLNPNVIGMGYGRLLMDFALTELNANKVDVNEQNQRAIRFYEYFGFETFDRTEKDSAGKDYPILKMRLKKIVPDS